MAGFTTTVALAQQPNPPHQAKAETRVIKKTGTVHKTHVARPMAPKSNATAMRHHTLRPAYVKGKHSYRPEDNEKQINGGHAQNMGRNLNYQNNGAQLPPSTGGVQK